MDSKEILVDPEKVEWENITLPGMKIKYVHKDDGIIFILDSLIERLPFESRPESWEVRIT